MSLVDVVFIDELTQTEVDPNTSSTTVHTKLNLPDGGTGFLIIGRVVIDKKQRKWEPLKDVIKKVLIEYDEKYNPVQPASEKNPLLSE